MTSSTNAWRLPHDGVSKPIVSYSEAFACHKRASTEFVSDKVPAAFEWEQKALNLFVKVFHEEKHGTNVPALLLLARNLKRLAIMASDASGTGSSEKLLEAEMAIKKAMKEVTGKAIHAKKWGCIEMANQLMWIYFRLTKLGLCNTQVQQVDRYMLKRKNNESEPPRSHLVKWRYYRGRLALFNMDAARAEEALDYAFRHCHRDSHKNKRLILHALVPAKLLCGKFPTVELLQKYNLHQFQDLVLALRMGDLARFERAVNKNQAFLIHKGLFVLIARLRKLLFRNLFMRIHKIINEIVDEKRDGSSETSHSNKVSLERCTEIMQSVGGASYDKDRVHCIVAGLIDRGFVKGYISEEYNKLVLSRKNPFPKVVSKMFA